MNIYHSHGIDEKDQLEDIDINIDLVDDIEEGLDEALKLTVQ